LRKFFSRQVEGLGNEGDVLVALSTSGSSKNVIKAIKTAIAKRMAVIFLTGADPTEVEDRGERGYPCTLKKYSDNPGVPPNYRAYNNRRTGEKNWRFKVIRKIAHFLTFNVVYHPNASRQGYIHRNR